MMTSTSSGRSDPSGTPGLRFYPTEEELLGFYLRHRLAGTRLVEVDHVIPVVDVYAHHPSELPSMAGDASARDTEQWFFFYSRAERGRRPARTTPSGYWKATGSPSCVLSSPSGGSSSKVIGVRRTMVFYQGRAPTGTKTSWKMNEYRATAGDGAQPTACVQLRNELSVCRVYISTGTLRSFDRRPVNPPGHYQAAPSSARTASTSIAVEAIAGAGQKTDYSHDRSWSGSREITAVDDGNKDAAIDWNSLITTADEFSFGIDGFNSSTIGAWPLI